MSTGQTQRETVAKSTQLTWVAYDPDKDVERTATNIAPQGSVSVRRHAALVSAAARKATIAKNNSIMHQRQQRRRRKPPSSEQQESNRVPKARAKAAKAGVLGRSRIGLLEIAFDKVSSSDLATYVSSLLRSPPIGLQQPSMSLKAIRTQLLDAFTNSSTLFQAALFMSGTHSNTCGLPPSALHADMGTGMILLRGATMDAIQTAVVAENGSGTTSVAIALLAAWERRYGDRQSYEIHVRAWQTMSLCPGALEVNSIATLADLTLEGFREGLNERSTTTTSSLLPESRIGARRYPASLPPGFMVFSADRPEAMSLLHLVAQDATHVPGAVDAPARMRKVCVENMAWGASHSISCETMPAHEDSWDQAELNALYHVRAACISINGVILQATLDAHGMELGMDLAAGLAIHTESCKHLRSEALMGTKYQEVAIWARFIMCAISREPSTDRLLRSFLQLQGVRSWNQLGLLLERHLYPVPLLEMMSHKLYNQLNSGQIDQLVHR
ncbi:hypothetical protein LTR36_002980 [Oleoguttula mirabilis]|uniref:Uncharacterized protein n=1 Tax=Oleoguttula mirabilis TaxID=1507867 RepID=A0AAV9JWK8_9PEZI|nr:hypothetical protein LTR36_002980 [Oleoguttula mirabilis]